MNDALRSRDSERLRTEAHQIKGTAGAMGYPAMTRQAGTVEALAKSADPDWERIGRELSALNDMIDRALASQTESP
ncbi:Hpt domain-containing protein [Marinobacter koreensis]